MRTRTTASILTLLMVPAWTALPAQDPDLYALGRALKRNQEELRNYTWRSKSEVIVEGELDQVLEVQATYTDQGTLEQIPLTDEMSKSDGGPIAKRKAKKRKKKGQMFNQELRDLITSYTQLSPNHMQWALTKAKVRESRQEGQLRVQARSVVRQGDTVDLWIDRISYKPLRFEIFTSLEGEPIKLTAKLKSIEGGPSYAADVKVETEMKEKKVLIKTTNYEYVREDE